MHDMSDDQIRILLDGALSSKSENYRVEFKDARQGLPKDIWEPVSAFSNCPGGGAIFFGIAEDRTAGTVQLVGCPNLAALQEKTVSCMNDLMVNSGKYSLKTIGYEGQQVLVLLISETSREKKPCYNRSIGLPNGACIRQGNTNRKITDEEMRTFIRYSADYRYDRAEAVNTSVDDLSIEKLKVYLEKSAARVGRKFTEVAPSEKVLKNLGVISKFEQVVRPTVAGYLIFSKDTPQLVDPFSRYVVRGVRYSGTSSSSNIVDSQDIGGTLD